MEWSEVLRHECCGIVTALAVIEVCLMAPRLRLGQTAVSTFEAKYQLGWSTLYMDLCGF